METEVKVTMPFIMGVGTEVKVGKPFTMELYLAELQPPGKLSSGLDDLSSGLKDYMVIAKA